MLCGGARHGRKWPAGRGGGRSSDCDRLPPVPSCANTFFAWRAAAAHGVTVAPDALWPVRAAVTAHATRRGLRTDERRRFGGLAFMVGGKMACGVVGEELMTG
jgi:hypothetical protein